MEKRLPQARVNRDSATPPTQQQYGLTNRETRKVKVFRRVLTRDDKEPVSRLSGGASCLCVSCVGCAPCVGRSLVVRGAPLCGAPSVWVGPLWVGLTRAQTRRTPAVLLLTVRA